MDQKGLILILEGLLRKSISLVMSSYWSFANDIQLGPLDLQIFYIKLVLWGLRHYPVARRRRRPSDHLR